MRTPMPFALPQQPTRGRDLVALGVSARQLERAVNDGRLVRIRTGVYICAGAWPEDPREQHLLRAWAEQLVKPEGVVSHRSAALHWDLPLPREDWVGEPVWLTLPKGAGYRSEVSGRFVQRTGSLPERDVVRAQGGCRVTTLARTAIDVVSGMDLPDSLVVLDAALRQLCTGLVVRAGRRDFSNPRLVAAARESVMEVAAYLPRRPAVLEAARVADPSRESPIESLSFGHMVLAGLPLPRCQAPIRTQFGVFFPDFYWEEAGLIGESDGRVKYTDSGAVMREKEREQALRDLGLRFVRWSGKEIHLTPQAVVARIQRSLDSDR